MWAQVWDRHLESQKNPDRLKRIIHVDRIGVHSTFVYIYAVLRVLMIWANLFFLLTCLFSWEKQKMWRQSANHSLSLRWASKTAPWEFQTKLLHHFFTSNNKSNVYFTDTCVVPSVCNAIGLPILLKLCPVFNILEQLITKVLWVIHKYICPPRFSIDVVASAPDDPCICWQ